MSKTAHHPSAYLGHLPKGNPVQAHSADEYYARLGIVMQAIGGTNGKLMWQATQNGRVVFSHPEHNKARDAAVMLLTGA